MILGIGINCDDSAIDGRLDRLAAELARAEDSGFDAYELSLEACNIVRGGRIDWDELERVKAILAGRALHYTVHGPCELRLVGAPSHHRDVFLSALEASAELHARTYVYHSAQIALRPADQDTAPLPGEAALQQLWQQETELLAGLAPEAAKRGIVIAVENRDPHLWEIAALARHGKPASDLITYHQGMRLDLLAAQISRINSPSVGMCLDVGHAFLAAPYWPQPNYLAGIRQAAPAVRHIHFHDNFGRLDDLAGSMRERLVFGEADCHLPPGWGAIPLRQVLTALNESDYAGWLTVELNSRYLDHMPQVSAHVQAMIVETGG